MSRNIFKNKIVKNRQKRVDHARKSATHALKTASKNNLKSSQLLMI